MRDVRPGGQGRPAADRIPPTAGRGPAVCFGRRRTLLAAGAALTTAAALAAPPAARRAGAALPGSATLLVPGPAGAPLDHWAQRVAAILGRGASAAVSLRPEVLGGADGVTAANRFATAAAADGRTLLVLPGAACQARLIGDPRARFDPTGWVPVCAAPALAVLVAGRRPLPRGPGASAGRLGLPAPDHPLAAAVLGLDLLGLPCAPVFGQGDGTAGRGGLDAVAVQGPAAELAARIAALRLHPWFVLDGGGGEDRREPGLADVPRLQDLLGPPPGPAAAPAEAVLQAALRAAGAAARLQAAVVLPALSSADIVALWRGAAGPRGGEEAARGGGGGAAARGGGQQGGAAALPGAAAAAPPPLVPGAEAASLLAALSPPAEAATAYRAWMAQRLNWRPG